MAMCDRLLVAKPFHDLMPESSVKLCMVQYYSKYDLVCRFAFNFQLFVDTVCQVLYSSNAALCPSCHDFPASEVTFSDR